jgi:hypothetical protein
MASHVIKLTQTDELTKYWQLHTLFDQKIDLLLSLGYCGYFLSIIPPLCCLFPDFDVLSLLLPNNLIYQN